VIINEECYKDCKESLSKWKSDYVEFMKEHGLSVIHGIKWQKNHGIIWQYQAVAQFCARPLKDGLIKVSRIANLTNNCVSADK